MKKSIFNLALSTFVVGTVLTSCNSSSEKVENAKINVQEASHDLDKAKENYNEQYNNFKLESDEKIAANEKTIAELKESNRKKNKKEKAEEEKKIDELEQKNETMKSRMKDYKEDGNEKWESFKREFKHDMDELGQSLKDLGKNNVK